MLAATTRPFRLAPAPEAGALTVSLDVECPVIGWVRVTACDEGLTALDFLGKPGGAGGFPASSGKSKAAHHLGHAAEWLATYAATGMAPELPTLAPRGTAFQRQVWEALGGMGVGQILSYRELGALVGRPNAARCVGGAVGRNPLPVLIPCHRVLAANRQLGGYSGGLGRKISLLRHEGIGWRE